MLFYFLYLSFIKLIQLNARLAKLYMFVAFSYEDKTYRRSLDSVVTVSNINRKWLCRL